MQDGRVTLPVTERAAERNARVTVTATLRGGSALQLILTVAKHLTGAGGARHGPRGSGGEGARLHYKPRAEKLQRYEYVWEV